jgi:hypothetical protein
VCGLGSTTNPDQQEARMGHPKAILTEFGRLLGAKFTLGRFNPEAPSGAFTPPHATSPHVERPPRTEPRNWASALGSGAKATDHRLPIPRWPRPARLSPCRPSIPKLRGSVIRARRASVASRLPASRVYLTSPERMGDLTCGRIQIVVGIGC